MPQRRVSMKRLVALVPALCLLARVAALAEASAVPQVPLRSTAVIFADRPGDSRRALLEPSGNTTGPRLGSGHGVHTKQWVVALEGPVHHRQVAALEDHVKADNGSITGFLGSRAFLVAGGPDMEAHLWASGAIAVTSFRPEHKVASELTRLVELAEAVDSPQDLTDGHKATATWLGCSVASASGQAECLARAIRLSVRVSTPWKGAPDTARRQEALLASCRSNPNVSQAENLGPQEILVVVPLRNLRATLALLAENPMVEWLDLSQQLSLHGWQASAIVQSGATPPSLGPMSVEALAELQPIWAAGLTGASQLLGMGDSGIDMQSCYFADEDVPFRDKSQLAEADKYGTPFWADPAHRKVVAYRAIADWEDSQGHGTHVAGSAAGNSTTKNLSSFFNGLAPSARIVMSDIVDSSGELAASLASKILGPEYFEFAYSRGARVHSDSWGGYQNTYNSHAAAVDLFSWSHPEFLTIASAGNAAAQLTAMGASMSITSPATAKNSLSVGASMTGSTGAVASFSIYRMRVTNAAQNGGSAIEPPVVVKLHPATFGTSLERLILLESPLKMALPLDLCGAPANSAELSDAVVLAKRSADCQAAQQVQLLQSAGAKAVILVNFDGSGYFTLSDIDGDTSVAIAAASVPLSVGARLVSALESGRLLKASFSRTQEPANSIENLASFSAIGPTLDGRLKPDLVAPGITTSADLSDGQSCSAHTKQGTSMAAPLVAASALLVREYFQAGFYPTKALLSHHGFSPSGALVKAVLLNGAHSLEGFVSSDGSSVRLPLEPAPSFAQGYGRVSLSSSLPLQSNTESSENLQVVDQAMIATGELNVYCLESTGGPLAVTLVWHDHPAAPAAAKTLVNDLDLVVRAAGLQGTLLLGNGGADHVNNVEHVAVPDLPAGPLSIEIRGAEIPLGPQPYSLVVRGAIEGVLHGPHNPQNSAGGSGAASCSSVIATIEIGPQGLTNNSYPTFTFATHWGESTSGGYECKLLRLDKSDGLAAVEWTSCTSPWNYRNLQDGRYEFHVRGRDEPLSDVRTFVVDTKAPQSSILDHPSIISSDSSAGFTFRAEDEASAVASFECRHGMVMIAAQWVTPDGAGLEVDDSMVTWGGWQPCATPYSLQDLAPSDWKFAVRARDMTGNAEATGSSFAWRVEPDMSKNFTLLVEGPRAAVSSTSVEFEFVNYVPSSSAKKESPTSADQVRCVLEVNDGGWSVVHDEICASPYGYSALSEAEYRFTVEGAVDVEQSLPASASFSLAVGDSRPQSAAETMFRVDLTPPAVSITAAPESLESSSVVVVEFEGKDGGYMNFECQLLGLGSNDAEADDALAISPSTWAPCESPKPYINLQDGRYVFYVRAEDDAGNIGEPESTEFLMDSTPPEIASIAALDGNDNPLLVRQMPGEITETVATMSSEVTLLFEVADGVVGSGVANVFCIMSPLSSASRASSKFVGGPGTLPPHADWKICESPLTYSLEPGAYSFTVQAIDQAANTQRSEELLVLIDGEAPESGVAWGPNQEAPIPPRVVFKLVATDSGPGQSWVDFLECMLETSAVSEASPVLLSFHTGTDFDSSFDAVSEKMSQVSAGHWIPCNETVVYDDLPSGSFAFSVRATDAAGNLGLPSELVSFIVDASLPVPSERVDFADWGYEGSNLVGPPPSAASLPANEDGSSSRLHMASWMWITLGVGVLVLLCCCISIAVLVLSKRRSSTQRAYQAGAVELGLNLRDEHLSQPSTPMRGFSVADGRSPAKFFFGRGISKSPLKKPYLHVHNSPFQSSQVVVQARDAARFGQRACSSVPEDDLMQELAEQLDDQAGTSFAMAKQPMRSGRMATGSGFTVDTVPDAAAPHLSERPTVHFGQELPPIPNAQTERPRHRRSHSVGGEGGHFHPRRPQLRRASHTRGASAADASFDQFVPKILEKTMPMSSAVELSEDPNPRGHKRHRSGDFLVSGLTGEAPSIEIHVLAPGVARPAHLSSRTVRGPSQPLTARATVRTADMSIMSESGAGWDDHYASSGGTTRRPSDE